MENKFVFVGFGELILDKTYDERKNLLLQQGGGTTWNILHNLSLLDVPTYAIAVCGEDKDGDKAIKSLEEKGVNTRGIRRINKSTNIVYTIIPDKIDRAHTKFTTTKSPITGEDRFQLTDKVPRELLQEIEDKNIILIEENFEPYNLEIMDKIQNKKVVIDIGHEKFMRPYDSEYILDFLSRGDVLQINNDVVGMLCEKTKIKSIEELFEKFDFDLVYITDGPNDVKIFYRENEKIKMCTKKQMTIENLVDTTGAGDAFLSIIIKAYSEYLRENKEIDKKFIDIAFKKANELAKRKIAQLGARYRGKIKDTNVFGEDKITDIVRVIKTPFGDIEFRQMVNDNNRTETKTLAGVELERVVIKNNGSYQTEILNPGYDLEIFNDNWLQQIKQKRNIKKDSRQIVTYDADKDEKIVTTIEPILDEQENVIGRKEKQIYSCLPHKIRYLKEKTTINKKDKQYIITNYEDYTRVEKCILMKDVHSGDILETIYKKNIETGIEECTIKDNGKLKLVDNESPQDIYNRNLPKYKIKKFEEPKCIQNIKCSKTEKFLHNERK